MNNNEALINKIKEAKTDVQTKLFKQFCKADIESLATIKAKLDVLEDISFTLINNIRNDKWIQRLVRAKHNKLVKLPNY